MEKKLSIVFGLLIGGMWLGEILLGNLGGTSVLGNLAPASAKVLKRFALRLFHVMVRSPWRATELSGEIM